MSFENIRQAISALRANWVRTTLTMLIVAFGIMAVVGILTAIDSAIYSLNDNFSSLGANSISIREKSSDRRGRRGGQVDRRAEPISYDEALAFEDAFGERANVAIEMNAAGGAVVKFGDEETNPVVSIIGADADYINVKNYDLELGRGLTVLEARRGSNVGVIGPKLVDVLFDGKHEDALGKTILVGPLRLEVIGTIQDKGSSNSGGADNTVIVPLQTARRAYGTSRTRFTLLAALPITTDIDAGVSTATGTMRVARGLSAKQDNDFEITTSDSLLEELRENTAKLQAGAIAIGLMTLFGAAIGLMNIMLVSVTERTREIGIAKALGASKSSILTQFLTESVVVTQLGGAIGILFGIAIGNIVTFFAGGEFLIPWGWIIISFIVCLATGLISGLYPAVKASRLDPIESLRYE